jgi:hypothetical protein
MVFSPGRDHALDRHVSNARCEEQTVAPAVEHALVLHLAIGAVDILGDVRFQEILGERKVRIEELQEHLFTEKVADGIFHGSDVGPDPVLAHERKETEGVALAAVVDHYFAAVLGDHRDLDPAFFDDPERVARRSVLLQDHHVLGIELQGQVPGHCVDVGVVEELEGRDLLQEGHNVFHDHVVCLVRLYSGLHAL